MLNSKLTITHWGNLHNTNVKALPVVVLLIVFSSHWNFPHWITIQILNDHVVLFVQFSIINTALISGMSTTCCCYKTTNDDDDELFLWCGLTDERRSLISSQNHCQISSPSRIFGTPPAGFELARNLCSCKH